MFCRGIDPKLNNLLPPAKFMNIIWWTFAVNCSHTCIHPLCSTGINNRIISSAIAMVDTPLEDKCYRRKSAMGMWPNTRVMRFNMLWHFYIGMME
jgi:hypothetical protein